MTTTSGSDSPTNYGPLTTTFNPSPGCFTEKWISHIAASPILLWGYACQTSTFSLASSCWPEGLLQVAQNTDLGNVNHVFSPGTICPSGWEAAYRSTYGVAPGSFTYNAGADFVTMQSGDIMTACCPSGYDLGISCTQRVHTLGQRQLISANSDSVCSIGTIKTFDGTLGTHTGVVATLKAKPIVLIINTASASTSTSTSSTGNSSTAVNNTTGLSTGAKIAIGICVPAGVLLIGAALFIFWHRRRKSKASQNPVPETPAFERPANEDVISEMPVPDPQKSEFKTYDPKFETSGLTGSQTAPVEMSGEGVFELAGDAETSTQEGVGTRGNDSPKG